jgi:hypothetical protein
MEEFRIYIAGWLNIDHMREATKIMCVEKGIPLSRHL